MPEDTWPGLLAAATGLHAGFQLVVTALVYPALADLPATTWTAAHERHGRRITPLVAVVYAAVLAGCAGALLAAPGPATVLAAGLSATALLVTAAVAAPLHGRLGRGHEPALVRRLLVADRVRALAAVLALAAALAGLTRG